MKSLLKFSLFTPVILISLGLAACSGVPGGSVSAGGGGGTSGPFSIAGTVSGLAAGGSMTLQNNGTDSLTVSSNGTFTFKTPIVANKAFLVTVSAAPTTPPQTCTVSGGSGTATANVSTVLVTCTTGTQAIGVTVAGLSGTGLILQNGTEFLTITGTTTTSQFKTAIPYGQPFNVTVSTQPSGPPQTCTVTNGSGISTAGVAINVQVTCSLGTLSIGGSVSGYSGGAGFTLQNNGGDSLVINKNGAFTFPTLIPVNGGYNVTVSGQPAGPNQTCTVSFGKGTATANVTTVSVICPAVFHPINVSVVGVLGTSGSMQLQDNGGDNLMTPKNGDYVFATPIAHGSSYDVGEFVASGTQLEGCIVWGFSGVALSTPVNPIPVADCGHNDWTWMAGTNATDQFGVTRIPTKPPTPPVCPPVSTDTPGGNNYSATWTDKSGNLWLLTGDVFTSGTPPISNLPGFFNELWEFTGTANYRGGCGNFWTLMPPPAPVPPAPAGPIPPGRWGAVTWTDPVTGHLWLFGGQDGFLEFLNDLWEYDITANTWTQHSGGGNMPGVYGIQGTAAAGNLPGGRWGASARLDAAGNVWVFGGFGCDSTGPGCSNLLLNDLWKYTNGQWTWVSGANTGDQAGTYGTQGTAAAGNVPPGRQASVAWVDNSGHFWMFGGFTTGTNGFNDLWKFDPLVNEWTWVSGSKGATSTPGNYGTQGVAASTNVPGARWLSAAWSDTHGNLWLFGGEGFDATGDGSLGDLWEFAVDPTTDPGNPSTIALNQWTWIKGPDAVAQPGIYGLAPNPAVWPHVTNNPGTRWGAAYWTTTPAQTGDQEFWMLGGEGVDATASAGKGFMLLNDLWRYLPYP
jgi:Galactose oxidase, central domain